LHTSDLITDLLVHRTDVALRIGGLRDATSTRSLGTSRPRVRASPVKYARAGCDDARSPVRNALRRPLTPH
jgi:hypothetical protein